MTRTLRILKDDYDRFVEIQKKRPQDTTNAETFNYILRVFEESPLRVTEKNHPLSEIAIKRAVLRAVNEAPTKNNTYQEKE